VYGRGTIPYSASGSGVLWRKRGEPWIAGLVGFRALGGNKGEKLLWREPVGGVFMGDNDRTARQLLCFQ